MGKNIWEIYKGDDKNWRWRCTAPNHEIVGASTEGYKNRVDCVDNAKRFGYEEESQTEGPL